MKIFSGFLFLAMVLAAGSAFGQAQIRDDGAVVDANTNTDGVLNLADVGRLATGLGASCP